VIVVEDKVYIGKKLIGSLANEYNVPYIVDNA
jgi:hypothetical protein